MIYLVTDSTAYLSRQEAKELGVLVVPMSYTVDGRESRREGFVEDWAPPENNNSLVGLSTSQAPTQSFVELFQRLHAQGHSALCLTISSRLSGTYANAQKAAEDFPGRVMVVDSRTTGAAMYQLLKEARRMLDEGRTLDECLEELKALRKRSRTILTIQDMEPLRRSGRLGFMRSSVSTLLNLRPLLTLHDGAVVSHALARGKQDQLRQMVLGLSGQPKQVYVQYCGEEEAAQELAKRLRDQGLQVHLRKLGIVLAIHLGIPILSTAWVEGM